MTLEQYLDFMYAATVIPSRSVGRIRRALAEGRDVDPYLRDIEAGLTQVDSLYHEATRVTKCPTCGHSKLEVVAGGEV